MRIRYTLFTAALLLSPLTAQAQQWQAPAPVSQSWGAITHSSLTITGISSVNALPSIPAVLTVVNVCNQGANDAYVLIGGSGTVVTTATGSLVKAGACTAVSPVVAGSVSNYIAAITGSGSTTLYVETGIGTPPKEQGGGGSGTANQKVNIDQTTPGTTNGVSVNQVNGNTISTGTGTSGTGTPRVVTSTDSTIGVEGADGSTQASVANPLPVSGPVSQPTASNFNAQVQGPAASLATASGNPIANGCVYNTTQPSPTAGQVVYAQSDAAGNCSVVPYSGANSTTADAIADANVMLRCKNSAGVSQACYVPSRPWIWNGTTWDRLNTIASGGTNTGLATAIAPTSAVGGAIAPVVSNAASTLLGKASAGNLYSVYLTTTADSWLFVYNSTTVPTNGSPTYGTASGNVQDCIKVPTGTTGSINYAPGPMERFSVGIYFAISSTACTTLTLATTGNLHGMVQ